MTLTMEDQKRIETMQAVMDERTLRTDRSKYTVLPLTANKNVPGINLQLIALPKYAWHLVRKF